MEKEDLIQRALLIKNVSTQREELYSLLDELGITYSRTRCIKCLNDYLNIIKEELSLIPSASEVSPFNDSECEYKYIRKQTVLWLKDGQRIKINQNTPIEIIKEFIKTHPGYFVCK